MTKLRLAVLVSPCLVSLAHGESWHGDSISGCRVWDDEGLEDR